MTLSLDTGVLVDLANRPGELKRVTEALADAGVNIVGISAVAMGDEGRAALQVDEPERAVKVLESAGLDHEEATFLSLDLADRPGELHRVLARFADEGINVESVLATADATPRLAFLVSDPDAARDVLES